MRSATFDELCKTGILEIGDGYRAKNSELGGNGPIFLRSAYLQDQGFVREMPERFKLVNAGQLEPKASQLGDVVITTKGNSTGRIGVIREDQVGAIYSPHLSYWRSLDREKLDQRFLAYWAQTPEFKLQLGGMAYSTDMAPYLSLRDQRRLRISIPQISFQRAAELLQVLDDKIELNRRMNETLEAMAQAIFREWFVDFGPTRRKMEGATDPVTVMGGLVQDTERAQALADLFSATLADDGLPDGWTEEQVGDVTTLLKRGLTPFYVEDGILVINQKCIRNGAVDFSVARRHDVVKRPPRDRFLQEYDVVINSTGVGTLGRVATVRGLKEEATADSHVTICRADTSRVSKLVLSLFMEGQAALIETLGHGSTGQTELSPASLAALTLPVASGGVQLAFDNFVFPLRDLVTLNSEQSLTLAATRDLLLPKLMSGEIRLGEAVEAAA